jgi:hypothetical protein
MNLLGKYKIGCEAIPSVFFVKKDLIGNHVYEVFLFYEKLSEGGTAHLIMVVFFLYH